MAVKVRFRLTCSCSLLAVHDLRSIDDNSTGLSKRKFGTAEFVPVKSEQNIVAIIAPSRVTIMEAGAPQINGSETLRRHDSIGTKGKLTREHIYEIL